LLLKKSVIPENAVHQDLRLKKLSSPVLPSAGLGDLPHTGCLALSIGAVMLMKISIFHVPPLPAVIHKPRHADENQHLPRTAVAVYNNKRRRS